MIRLLGKIPHSTYLACSGGTDSMVVLDFLLRGRKSVHALYFNHGTPHGDEAEDFVKRRCESLGVPFTIGTITRDKLPRESREEYWRNQRYEFFQSFTNPIVMCHHLDDCIENWLFSALNGQPRTIPYRNRNVIRPFLLTPKSELEKWGKSKSVETIQDPSNNDVAYMRSYIRHNLVPHALAVNPGLHKVIARVVQKQYDQECATT